MNVLICAGGTGPRVLESLVHMACAGVGPEEVTVLMIDADQSNGNTNRMKRLFESYFSIKDLFENTGFFETTFDFLDLKNANERSTNPKIYSPVQDNERLRDIINFDGLDATETPPELADVFFTRESELNLELDVGFRGHPAIGAASLSLTTRFTENDIWSNLIKKVQLAVANQTKPVKICIVGSVFGGTGASTFEPISRFLKDQFQNFIQQDKVDIGAIFMTPYFQYVSVDQQGVHAKADRFAIATRAAVEFYQHLRENNELNFSSMYWLGDRNLMDVYPSNGGPKQENPSHPVELLAGMAINHFFESEKRDKLCLYCSPSQNSHRDLHFGNPFSWNDLPFTTDKIRFYRTAFLSLYRFAIVHNYFYMPLFRDERLKQKPMYLPWLEDHKLYNLLNNDNLDKMEKVKIHFERYYFEWIKQLYNSKIGNGRFFNIFPLINNEAILQYLNNLDWQPPEKAGYTDDYALHEILTRMCESKNAAGNGINRYFNLLKEAIYY
ncbi:MAG: tubulin-like doman-containing protein [bacterium]|nr:tubulin-like doman-containing protein [bacterium]